MLPGLHMRALDDHVQAVITDADADADADENWQLIDVGATLDPNLPRSARSTRR